MKILIVVDMQKDFINGALGTPEAQKIVPAVAEKILRYKSLGYPIFFTRDTHGEDYLKTQEGRRLPVPHCIRDTEGWQISEKLDWKGCPVIDKVSFGSLELAEVLAGLAEKEFPETIELAGLCTDICIIANAMVLKARLPECTIAVDSACCAGVTPESHSRALEAMTACQVDIL